MPLLKLWNAIWGRSAGETSVVEQPASPSPAVVASSPASKPVSKPTRPVSKPTSHGFSLFGSNPHGALCKLIAATEAKSVLEVAVGDGSRAIAVVETLAKAGVPVRYFGIDQFELAGGTVSLKEFHRTLRGAGIRPQLFPEPVDRGLIRFLHTVGTVDLVLLSQPEEILEDPRVRQLLGRISHPRTTILHRQGEVWTRLTSGPTVTARAA